MALLHTEGQAVRCTHTANNTTASFLLLWQQARGNYLLTFELTSVADQGFVGPAAYTIFGALFKVKQN
jgi:hypothetical protein